MPNALDYIRTVKVGAAGGAGARGAGGCSAAGLGPGELVGPVQQGWGRGSWWVQCSRAGAGESWFALTLKVDASWRGWGPGELVGAAWRGWGSEERGATRWSWEPGGTGLL